MLIDLLPERYTKSNEIRSFQNALQPAVDEKAGEIEQLFRQLIVATADEGLEYWEKQYGITTDVSKTLAERRSVILSKLRGAGTTTKEMIRNVAESFVNGTVDIVEYPSAFRFDVQMISILGIPPNLDDLRQAIEEIKPAHLAFDIIMRFNTHGDIRSYNHRTLAGKTYREMREEVLS